MSSSSRLLRQAPALLPAVSRQARLLTVAKAKQQKGDKGGKKEAAGKQIGAVAISGTADASARLVYHVAN